MRVVKLEPDDERPTQPRGLIPRDSYYGDWNEEEDDEARVDPQRPS